MLVCFNNKGILKEQLDSYGNPARVGTQLFKIFAYFKGIEIENYGSAYIKLQRPDLNDSEYPILFMTEGKLTYNPNLILPSVSENFSAEGGPNSDHTYPGYLFDFGSVINTGDASDPSDDHIVSLLDTPGEWRATITLISTVTGVSNVVGTISFNVEGPASNEEETDIGFDVVVHNMAVAIAAKLNASSTYYMRLIDDFETKATDGYLLESIIPPGGGNVTVWDRTTKTFYRIDSVSAGSSEGFVGATWTKIACFDDKLDIASAIVVVDTPISLVDVSLYRTGQLVYSAEDGLFYRKITQSGGTVNYWGKAENTGILGSKNTLFRFVMGSGTQFSSIPYWVGDGNEGTVVLNYNSYDYIVQATDNHNNNTYNIVAFDVFHKCFYQKNNILKQSTMSSLITAENKIDHVVRKYDINTLYGVDENGNQVNLRIDDIFDGYIKYYQVPDYQTTVSVIADILTNINGWVLTNFDYVPVTISGYPGYKIVTTGDENLTKEQAAIYMKAMTGSEYVPEYDFNKPSNSFMMLPDGTILKPQWDGTNGLVLYKMKRFADVDYVDNNILSLANPSGTYGVLTDEQYAYVLKKNARVLNTSTGVYYEKQSENSSQIIFQSINSYFSTTSGVVTFYGNTNLVITKSNKRYAFGTASVQVYNKAKLDADFATKDFVHEVASELKRNSFIVVDTEDYPTLQDFLDDYPDPQPGFIYLYPVVVQQEVTDRGYYQYIWEDVNLGDDDDEASWFCIGTTQIDLSNFEIKFEQRTFNDGAVAVTFANNTDFKLISVIDTITVGFTIPSGISQGWISSCTFTIGNSIPTFSLTNNSSYNVVFIVNNRKADISAIGLNLDINGIVECMAECNGFDIRIYMKEVTN